MCYNSVGDEIEVYESQGGNFNLKESERELEIEREKKEGERKNEERKEEGMKEEQKWEEEKKKEKMKGEE